MSTVIVCKKCKQTKKQKFNIKSLNIDLKDDKYGGLRYSFKANENKMCNDCILEPIHEALK